MADSLSQRQAARMVPANNGYSRKIALGMEPNASQRRQITTGRADPRQRAFPLCRSTVEPPPNHDHLWMVQKPTQSAAEGSPCDDLYAEPAPPELDFSRMAH